MYPLFIALLTIVVVPHDYFISILTMRHDPLAQTIDMTWQMTAHDVEHALENVVDLKLGSQREHPKADSLLNVYFMEHLQLNRDSTQLQWQWIGKELEGENLFCYMQVQQIESIKGLRISNTLLHDVIPEQQNKLILEVIGIPSTTIHGIGTVWTYTFNLGDGPVLYGE
ncbi:MAG: DUF6702 family protein [Flavobacteriales bacterium]|nr:hypothetical protein [Flavobacteriales bacterium]